MLHKDEWLSQYFVQDAYVYKPPFDLKDFPAGFITAKVPADRISDMHGLCDKGFQIVEVLTQFQQKKPLSTKETDFNVRFSVPEDRGAVVNIAQDAFTFSRLYQDPGIDNDIAAQIKADWVANFYNGKRGNAMIVAEQAGRIMGFNLLINHVIDLIAVSKDDCRKGIAAAMIAFANEKIGFLSAGTQITNKPSIAMYQNCHFVMTDAQHVLHRHS